MSHISNRDFLKALATALLALLISAAVLIPAYLALFPTLHPEFADSHERSARPVTFKGAQFRPVVFGDGGIEGDSAVIAQLAEGRPTDQAVLVHQRRFNAADYPFLRHHIEGWHPGLRVMLFWRRADDPQTNHYSKLEYTGEGPGYFNLLRSEEWRGQIIELAVGFFGDLRGTPVKLHGVGLEPYSNGRLLEVAWGEWTAFETWDQTSINRYEGAPRGALALPNGAVSAWLIVAMLIGWVAARRWPAIEPQGWRFALPVNTLICFGVTWALLAALWTHKLWLQNQETRYLFAGKSLHERHLADWDGEYYALAQQIKATMPADAEKLAILYTEPNLHAPYPARLRYHLLPDKRAEYLRPVTRDRVKRATRDYDYILIINNPYDAPLDPLPLFQAQGYEPTGREKVLVQSPIGVLLALNK